MSPEPKDLREAYGQKGAEAVRELAANAEPYQPERDSGEGADAPDRDEFRKMLAERAFDARNPPPRPHPILKLDEKVIATPGNIMNIQAPAKAGKSAVVGAIIAAIIRGDDDEGDTLGFSSSNPGQRAVLHFDTEQSRFDHDGLIRRALNRINRDTVPAWFESYCLTDLPHGNRKMAWETAIEDAEANHEGVFAILLDGVADLARDPNNTEEAFALVDELHSLAIRLDCGLFTVLHENPGSESGKMRGHLGSQLERKAETPLRLAKDSETGITTVWADRARHCHIPKNEGSCFQWSDLLGQHVSAGSVREVKANAKHEKFREEACRVFGETGQLSYSGFVAKIEAELGCSKSTAERRVKTYVSECIVSKSPAGNYSLNP